MKVLVYGFYFHNNLGDQLFIDAFRYLFPTYEFTFVDHITSAILQNQDAIFIGGGSLLDGEPKIAPEVIDILGSYPIFYVGVGTETNIHPTHIRLMKLARFIAVRSAHKFDFIKSINPNTMIIPDLVYCLPNQQSSNKILNSLCIVPNILVVPRWSDPHWKHSAWQHFKIEFAQALDELSSKYVIHFVPMSVDKTANDQYAAIEIINSMKECGKVQVLPQPTDAQTAIDLLSQYSLVITQRYHGTVLANMARVPCLTIYHHDKLKSDTISHLSYHAFHKAALFQGIEHTLKTNILPLIDMHIIEQAAQKIASLI